jgi:hypothetical protein
LSSLFSRSLYRNYFSQGQKHFQKFGCFASWVIKMTNRTNKVVNASLIVTILRTNTFKRSLITVTLLFHWCLMTFKIRFDRGRYIGDAKRLVSWVSKLSLSWNELSFLVLFFMLVCFCQLFIEHCSLFIVVITGIVYNHDYLESPL